MKYESIHTNKFVLGYTNSIDKALFVANRTQRREKPTISVVALSDIASSCVVHSKLRILKNILPNCQPIVGDVVAVLRY